MRRIALAAGAAFLMSTAPAAAVEPAEPLAGLKRAAPGSVAAGDSSLERQSRTAEPVSRVRAERIVEAAEAEFESTHGTGNAVVKLARTLAGMSGEPRRRGEELLARPGDPGDGDQYDAPVFSAFSENFCYFWAVEGKHAISTVDANGVNDGDGTPDYIEALGGFAEQSRSVEHGPLGWALPVSDGTRGCDGGDGRSRTDIYVLDLDGIYGYAVPDPGPGKKLSASMQVDEDQEEFTQYTDPMLPLAVTVAHEYNHVLQTGYDAIQDAWMDESVATWSEEQVYPAINDYLQYVIDVARFTEQPLTKDAGNNLKIYGSAVFNHFLTSRLGVGVLPSAYSVSTQTNPADFAPAAYDAAIKAASGGRSSFAKEFALFAAASAEWKTNAAFPDAAQYPDVERVGTLRVTDRFYKRQKLAHTTFRLFRVKAPGSGTIRLNVRVKRPVRAAMAIVARSASGTVVRFKALPKGGNGNLRLSNPGRFSRITAVIVNADFRTSGYRQDLGDWAFPADGTIFDTAIYKGG